MAGTDVQALPLIGPASTALLSGQTSRGQHRQTLASNDAHRWPRAMVPTVRGLSAVPKSHILVVTEAQQVLAIRTKYPREPNACVPSNRLTKSPVAASQMAELPGIESVTGILVSLPHAPATGHWGSCRIPHPMHKKHL